MYKVFIEKPNRLVDTGSGLVKSETQSLTVVVARYRPKLNIIVNHRS